MPEVKCTALSMPLNSIADELLGQLERVSDKADAIDDKLYSNCRAKNLLEKADSPSGLQAKLDQAVRIVMAIDEKLDAILSKA